MANRGWARQRETLPDQWQQQHQEADREKALTIREETRPDTVSHTATTKKFHENLLSITITQSQ